MKLEWLSIKRPDGNDWIKITNKCSLTSEQLLLFVCRTEEKPNVMGDRLHVISRIADFFGSAEMYQIIEDRKIYVYWIGLHPLDVLL